MLDDCLRDWVGLDAGCEPASGLYVNALPGVSLEGMEAGADGEQAHYPGVWRAVQTAAFAKFRTDVLAAFGPCFRPTLSNGPLSAGKPGGRPLPQQPGLRGLRFKIPCGDFARVYLRRISVRLVEPVDLVLLLADGESLVEINVSGAAGNNVLDVEHGFLPELEIAYDATDVYADGGPIAQSDVFGFAGGADVCDECFGLSVEYEIRCDFDRWLCSMKTLLRTPLWYLLGAEALRQRIGSDRFNRFTTFDRDGLRALFQDYENEYQKALKNVCASIRLPNDPCFCFDPPVQSHYL